MPFTSNPANFSIRVVGADGLPNPNLKVSDPVVVMHDAKAGELFAVSFKVVNEAPNTPASIIDVIPGFKPGTGANVVVSAVPNPTPTPVPAGGTIQFHADCLLSGAAVIGQVGDYLLTLVTA